MNGSRDAGSGPGKAIRLMHTETAVRPSRGVSRPLAAVHPLRLVRLQSRPRRFWREFLDDRRWIPLKLAILVALVLLAAVI